MPGHDAHPRPALVVAVAVLTPLVVACLFGTTLHWVTTSGAWWGTLALDVVATTALALALTRMFRRELRERFRELDLAEGVSVATSPVASGYRTSANTEAEAHRIEIRVTREVEATWVMFALVSLAGVILMLLIPPDHARTNELAELFQLFPAALAALFCVVVTWQRPRPTMLLVRPAGRRIVTLDGWDDLARDTVLVVRHIDGGKRSRDVIEIGALRGPTLVESTSLTLDQLESVARSIAALLGDVHVRRIAALRRSP